MHVYFDEEGHYKRLVDAKDIDVRKKARQTENQLEKSNTLIGEAWNIEDDTARAEVLKHAIDLQYSFQH